MAQQDHDVNLYFLDISQLWRPLWAILLATSAGLIRSLLLGNRPIISFLLLVLMGVYHGSSFWFGGLFSLDYSGKDPHSELWMKPA
jgi:hypothetical protein